MSHTPGPWRWLPHDGQFIVAHDNRIIAEIPCQGANPDDGPLLAAAPETLHALKMFGEHGVNCLGDLRRPCTCGLNAAIAKAEGREA